MEIEELRKRRAKLKADTDTVFENMDVIIEESYRVVNVAHNAEQILSDLDKEFSRQTGLDGKDIAFLFAATAMQCIRIYIINALTKTEPAGQGNRNEDFLHKAQEKIFSKLRNDQILPLEPYFAPLNHIIDNRGVPYDATAYKYEKLDLFKGANHRFSTLGHDPLFGLVFGTANILTNTITCVHNPLVLSFHVEYDAFMKNPKIGLPASTILMLTKAAERLDGDVISVVAALIKQIIHIGTDMFTPCGIQIPGANLVLSNKNAELLTKYISTGDLVKIGTSAKIAMLINTLISALHMLTYDENVYSSQDIFNVKTKKIIMYSNVIASTSNIIWVVANVAAGNKNAMKDLDIGGLIITIQRLLTDISFIQEVKKEFIYGSFNKLISGHELNIKEI